MTICFIVLGVFILFPYIGLMGVFHKAREPALAAFVPIYNLVVLARVGGCPPLYGVLAAFVPFAGIYWFILILLGVCQKFGKEPYYVVFLILFPFIFFPLLGLGPDEYGSKRRRRRKQSQVMIKRTFDDDELESLEEEEEQEERARSKARGDEDDDDDEEEEEERPRRRRRDEEDEEEEERPRKRRRPAADADEDEPPRSRPRGKADDRIQDRRRRPSRRDEDDDD